MDDNATPTEGTGEAASGEGASGRFGRARDYVGQKYSAASDTVRDSYNSMRERVEDVDMGELTDQVRTYVRSNPGKALLISVGVGFLIGLLLRGGEED